MKSHNMKSHFKQLELVALLTGAILVLGVGTAHGEPVYQDVVHSSSGKIVHSSNGECVRTQWEVGSDACADAVVVAQVPVHETRTVKRLTREDRTVYFGFNKADLIPQSKARLNSLAEALKTNQSVTGAHVVGYADRIGSVAYNDKLSQNRATTVRDYLVSQGYTNAQVTETRWVGKTQPKTSCPVHEKKSTQIACLQADRRVEVEIIYADQHTTTNDQ